MPNHSTNGIALLIIPSINISTDDWDEYETKRQRLNLRSSLGKSTWNDCREFKGHEGVTAYGFMTCQMMNA